MALPSEHSAKRLRQGLAIEQKLLRLGGSMAIVAVSFVATLRLMDYFIPTRPTHPLILSYKPVQPAINQVSVSVSEILPPDQWKGADSFNTNLCTVGLRVVGSFMQKGDTDTRSITLRLKQGDHLLYRSGPTGGSQMLEISSFSPVILPVAPEWVLMDFSDPDLPAQFVAKFSDNGDKWGEWSAVALVDKSCS